MGTDASRIENQVDKVLTRYSTGAISYYPYAPGVRDHYGQVTKAFGTGVSLVGRAILNPTSEQISVIGNNETYDIAFLFSRTEMLKKFPALSEGEWLDVTGEMTWHGRRYKIDKVKPTGQIQETFILVVVVANSIPGARD